MSTASKEGSKELETLAERVAYVIGPGAAAAKALAEMDRHRKAGRTPTLARIHDTWLVFSGESATPPANEQDRGEATPHPPLATPS
jgi:hypothetical protein